jgi:class 3 adenylate cyclase
MSRKVKKYVDYIEQLNKEYSKFIPNEIFKLLNKESITEINLGDQVIKNMCVMKISTKNFRQLSKEMDTIENFEFLNKLFGSISGIIKKTGGVVEDYEGAGLRAIYTQQADKSIDAALKAIEKINTYNQKSNTSIELNITIQNGDIMLGIVGDMERREATIISEVVNSIFFMERLVRENNINLLITGNVYHKIENKSNYHFRYIGKIKNRQVSSIYIDLYDVVDAYKFEDKKNKLLTKQDFELGVNAYILGDIVEARKHFVNVLRIDSRDETAKTYIFLCDKYLNTSKEKWEGIIADSFI